MTHQSIDDILRQEKHRRFTNRETELHLFEQLVRLSDSPLRILGIHGIGGIGKSDLLAEYKRLCKEWNIPYISIDGYAQKNVLSILNRLHHQAGRHIPQYYFTDFERYFYLYLRMQRAILNDEDLIAEFQRALDRSSLERQAVVGSSQTESAISLLRESFDPQDIEFYLRAESFLTEKLLASLAKMEEARWVLFIDAYEVLSRLDDWVRDSLVRQLPAFFRVVIAGRRRFGRRWQELRPVFKSVQLLAFGEEDTKEYLEMRGITEEDLVKEIFELTNGHPLYLAMSADAKEENPALSAGEFAEDDRFLAIDSITKSIKEGIKDARILEALEICSVVRFFDEDTLRYFIGEDLPSGLFDKLLTYSFVKKRSYGFALHDSVWEFLNAEQKQRSPLRFRKMNKRAISYYSKRIEHADSGEWQKFAIEILYHKMAIDCQEGLSFLVEMYNAVEAQYRLDFCEALIREAQTYKAPELEDWLTFFEARLANRRDDWEEARSRYEKLLRDKSLATELGAYVLDGLGRVYYRLGEIGKAEKVYTQALEAYNKAGRKREAVEVLYQTAKIKIAQRKWRAARKILEECLIRFDNMLESLSKELHSDPTRSPKPVVEREKAWVLSSLGTVYLSQGLWDQALDKYTESLEIFQRLKDDYGVARSLYRVGWALQQKGKWNEAIACYKQSREILVKLRADYRVARTIVKLADLYRMQGRLKESEEVYLECMRICIKLKAEVGIAVVLDSLGCLYQAQGLLGKAENVHGKSLARKRKLPFPFEIELTLMNLGDLKVRQGKVGQALEYYDQSLKLVRSMKNRYGEALVLVKMCEAATVSQCEDDTTIDWIKRAESLSKRYKYRDIQCRIHRLRGDWFFSAGDFELAMKEYAKALRFARGFNEYVYQDMRQSLLSRSIECPNVPEAIRLRNLLDENL